MLHLSSYMYGSRPSSLLGGTDFTHRSNKDYQRYNRGDNSNNYNYILCVVLECKRNSKNIQHSKEGQTYYEGNN